MLCCSDHREQLAGHVGRELDDAAGVDPDPFAVGAGDADETGEVGFGHAQELGFLPAHDVGPVGSGLGDAGQDADVAGRIDPEGALVQGIEASRCLEIRCFGPALPRARHAADQDRGSRRSAEPGEVIAQHRRKAAGAAPAQCSMPSPPRLSASASPSADISQPRKLLVPQSTTTKAPGAPRDVVSRDQTATPWWRISASGRRPARPGFWQGRASRPAHLTRRWHRRPEQRNPTSRQRSACR